MVAPQHGSMILEFPVLKSRWGPALTTKAEATLMPIEHGACFCGVFLTQIWCLLAAAPGHQWPILLEDLLEVLPEPAMAPAERLLVMLAHCAQRLQPVVEHVFPDDSAAENWSSGELLKGCGCWHCLSAGRQNSVTSPEEC